MRSSFTAETGLPLVRSPNPRRQASVRRWIAAAALAAAVLTAGLTSLLTSTGVVEPAAITGPFSYFPAQ